MAVRSGLLRTLLADLADAGHPSQWRIGDHLRRAADVVEFSFDSSLLGDAPQLALAGAMCVAEWFDGLACDPNGTWWSVGPQAGWSKLAHRPARGRGNVGIGSATRRNAPLREARCKIFEQRCGAAGNRIATSGKVGADPWMANKASDPVSHLRTKAFRPGPAATGPIDVSDGTPDTDDGHPRSRDRLHRRRLADPLAGLCARDSSHCPRFCRSHWCRAWNGAARGPAPKTSSPSLPQMRLAKSVHLGLIRSGNKASASARCS